MTELEMFKEICEKRLYAVLGNLGRNEFCVLTKDGDSLGATATTPEGAIEEAYKNLFPPIPEKVGGWKWCDIYQTWHFDSVYVHHLTFHDSSHCGPGYCFTLGKYDAPAAVVDVNRLDSFKILQNLNPKLKPPTEEDGQEKGEANP